MPDVRPAFRVRADGGRPCDAVEGWRAYGAGESADAVQGVQPAKGRKLNESGEAAIYQTRCSLNFCRCRPRAVDRLQSIAVDCNR